MELSEKLLRARQEAGLSQRQLCADVITRNMLSQIEHGTARPSMDTLRYLASRLGKPVSFFLDEEVLSSPNKQRIAAARQAASQNDPAGVRQALAGFEQPDEIYGWEYAWHMAVSTLACAELAAEAGKVPYAAQLLEEAEAACRQFPELERRRLLTLGRLMPGSLTETVKKLPSLDAELLLRAEAALEQKDADRAEALLAAAEVRDSRWKLLQGRMLMRKGEFPQAAEQLLAAESACPEICVPLLEECFQEMGDFRRAYEYACKRRG